VFDKSQGLNKDFSRSSETKIYAHQRGKSTNHVSIAELNFTRKFYWNSAGDHKWGRRWVWAYIENGLKQTTPQEFVSEYSYELFTNFWEITKYNQILNIRMLSLETTEFTEEDVMLLLTVFCNNCRHSWWNFTQFGISLIPWTTFKSGVIILFYNHLVQQATEEWLLRVL